MYQEKEITKVVYNNIVNSIQIYKCAIFFRRNKINIFMNSKNRLLINFSDKTNLKRIDKYVALSNLSIHFTWKNIKKHTKAINLK